MSIQTRMFYLSTSKVKALIPSFFHMFQSYRQEFHSVELFGADVQQSVSYEPLTKGISVFKASIFCPLISLVQATTISTLNAVLGLLFVTVPFTKIICPNLLLVNV